MGAHKKNSRMSLNTIEEALEDIANGKVVIVVDDEDRENEGDFVAAAESTLPTHVVLTLLVTSGLAPKALQAVFATEGPAESTAAETLRGRWHVSPHELVLVFRSCNCFARALSSNA